LLAIVGTADFEDAAVDVAFVFLGANVDDERRDEFLK
jgi:hypothetical protein